MTICVRRREFITALGAAAACPLDVRAQPAEPVRRIGILWRGDVSEGFVQALQRALLDGLAKLGWIEGRNVRFELRYSGDAPDRIQKHADELVGLGPDIIAASSNPVAQAVLQRTQTIPVVFMNVADPVAGGLLKNIARPEGNATGITSVYQPTGGKWLELLKEVAPRTARVALIFVPENVNRQFFGVIDAAAEVLAVNVIRAPYRNAAELQRTIDVFAAEPNGALLMVPPPPTLANAELINRLAVMYRLPTIYTSKYHAALGGMMSYGPPISESYQIAATYIDRILRGAKISELPVQFPTRVELVINLKTVKAIGLALSRQVQARADAFIE
jgi:putative tryptophan/tyrosine transport system substrate-binding protein